MRYIAAIALSVFLSSGSFAVAQSDWSTPHQPLRIFGNTYYVGTAGLSSILITSSDGHILIDGGLSQAAPVIEANIRTLGFQLRDVKLIVNSHEHYDHAGGLGPLQRATGARVAASSAAARALKAGHPMDDDPQYTSALGFRYDPIKNVETIEDRATLRVGPLAIMAHFTPGHTPGATTWSWKSCEGSRCVDIVYVDSLTPVSDDGFKFTGGTSQPSRVDVFRASIDRVEQLPCDVVIAPHPSLTDFAAKVARARAGATENPFIQKDACRTYAAAARKKLDQRVAQELK